MPVFEPRAPSAVPWSVCESTDLRSSLLMFPPRAVPRLLLRVCHPEHAAAPDV